ncbi:MAG: hypothetical protein EXS16_08640 [Gemmataceae bacterium]|nr:hypothetical protein [Gemmataceae bacterium]
MADIAAVTCPECDKKFKPKADVRGKKIKCPFCKEPFTVPAEKKSKAGAAKPKKQKADEPISLVDDVKPPEPPEPAKPERDTQFDNDPDPYGVKSQDLTPRCPDCAGELESATSIICLYCGYNSLTRERGQTKKVKSITASKQLAYLGPAIGAAAFVFSGIVFLIYFAVVSPYHVDGVPILNYTDHESIRMWFTVISLGILWGAGVFCFKKFIEKPNPDEEELD